MNWGSLFRSAWELASSGGRSAAREAAMSPEKAAGLMSDVIAHTLQRVQYAAQDVIRLQLAHAPAPDQAPGTGPLKQLMEDIRLGRIGPERSERHIHKAARAAVEQAKSAAPVSNEEEARRREEQQAVQRFAELRARLIQQMDAAQQKMRGNGAPSPAGIEQDAALRNLALMTTVSDAFARIDELFLPNKAADAPAAALPPARDINDEGSRPCPQPHA